MIEGRGSGREQESNQPVPHEILKNPASQQKPGAVGKGPRQNIQYVDVDQGRRGPRN